MERKDMKSKNWKMLITGIAIIFTGLVVVSLVGTNYHGIPALIASSLLLLGVVTIFWSLSANFE